MEVWSYWPSKAYGLLRFWLYYGTKDTSLFTITKLITCGHNLWSQLLKNDYKRHEDQFLSAKLYMESSEELHLICLQIAPFGLLREIFIDSTFRTNSAKLDLFAVIGSCMGTGITLDYFVLKAGSSGEFRSREVSYTIFANSKHRSVKFEPIFSLTDKKASKMAEIRNTFCTTPPL